MSQKLSVEKLQGAGINSWTVEVTPCLDLHKSEKLGL